MAINSTSGAAAPGDTPGPAMIDLEGLALKPEECDLIQHPLVGGIILFARNFTSLEQLQGLVAEIRQLVPGMLLAVDQEGGRVQRFKAGHTILPPMQTFLSAYREDEEATLALIRDTGWLMAAEILASGLDISFAPVLDVDDDHCSVIADRAFSAEPDQVVLLAEQFICGMHDAGMAVTGKHFPGHGGVTQDSHIDSPVDERSLDQLLEADMLPFRRLVEQLDAVMPAHITFPAVDPDYTVGFSRLWLQQVLRQQLGFDGVIFSDDLAMQGAASAGGFGDRAQRAMEAGCDMVLVCNNRAGAREVLQRLEGVNFPHAGRLDRMRGRQPWNWPSLRADSRWEQTREKLRNQAKK